MSATLKYLRGSGSFPLTGFLFCYAGMFYDLTESYDAAFFGLGVLSAVMTVLTPMDRFASSYK